MNFERRRRVAALDVRLALAQVDRGDEHQHVDDQVDLRRHHAEDPVGARDRRDERVEQRDDRRDRALDDEDVAPRPRSRSAAGRTAAGSPRGARSAAGPSTGPASQVSMPPADAQTSAIATIGTSTWRSKNAKNASNACMTPAVRLSSSAGITQLIASAGRMKISSTSPQAKNIARGNSFFGLLQRADVDRVHLHARVGEEVVDDEHEARDPRPLRDEVVGVHRRGRRLALEQVDDRRGSRGSRRGSACR